jgi:hypothetical protein
MALLGCAIATATSTVLAAVDGTVVPRHGGPTAIGTSLSLSSPGGRLRLWPATGSARRRVVGVAQSRRQQHGTRRQVEPDFRSGGERKPPTALRLGTRRESDAGDAHEDCAPIGVAEVEAQGVALFGSLWDSAFASQLDERSPGAGDAALSLWKPARGARTLLLRADRLQRPCKQQAPSDCQSCGQSSQLANPPASAVPFRPLQETARGRAHTSAWARLLAAICKQHTEPAGAASPHSSFSRRRVKCGADDHSCPPEDSSHLSQMGPLRRCQRHRIIPGRAVAGTRR